jgi:fructose-bisphosphate aldolase class 1
VRSTPSFPGVILIRFPDEWPTERVIEVILQALQRLAGKVLANCLIVVEPERIRIHLVS